MTSKTHSRTISALEDFLGNSTEAEGMTESESHDALDANRIEIARYNSPRGLGILVTENGYFLAPRHCVNEDPSHLELRLRDGSFYNIDTVCVRRKAYDIALVKAEIPKECKAMKYKFFDTDKLDINIPVSLMARYGGMDYQKQGKVIQLTNNIIVHDNNGNPCAYPDNFLIDMPIAAGDSGGIIISKDYRIMGLANAGNQVSMGLVAKWKAALELIEFYKDKL